MSWLVRLAVFVTILVLAASGPVPGIARAQETAQQTSGDESGISRSLGITGELLGVAATAPDNVWAVGYGAPTDLAAAPVPLILHWNGKTWS